MLNVEEIKELSAVLTPELLRFMELAQNTEPVLMPVESDVLIYTGQAATVLHTNTTMISRYVKEGLLEPVYTPHCSKRKFWLSEVKKLARRCDVAEASESENKKGA